MSDRQPSGISAIVLAAGTSTRMGQSKPLVRIDGKTMLERVLDTVRQSCVDETVVVLGHAADLIQAQVDLSNVRVVINHEYREGMAGSVRLGVQALRSSAQAALIVLADQPFLKPKTLNRLVAEYRDHHPPVVLPLFEGRRGNPVLLDREALAETTHLVGDVGFRSIFGKFAGRIAKVDVDDSGILVDLDTPADIAALNDGAHQMITRAGDV